MARQRFIWPSIWDDPDLAAVSEGAHLLYIACFSLADDDGRLDGSATFLRSKAFPYRKVSTRTVVRWRGEILSACSNLTLYSHNEREYLAFKNWREFQKPKYPSPSKLPAPPWDSGNASGNPSPNDSPSGSGNDSPTGRAGQGWVRDLAGSTSTEDPNSTAEIHILGGMSKLGDERYFHVAQLLPLLRDRDEKTADVIASYAGQLPTSVIVDLTERVREDRSRGAGWVVNALKSELEQRRAANA